MKKTYSFLALLIFCFNIFSQNHANRLITGKITDSETSEPIPSAAVFINGTTVGTSTDKDGIYQLKLPGAGSYDLAVSHTGYEPVFQRINISGALVKMDVALKIHEMEGVVISAKGNVVEADKNLFWLKLLGIKPSKNIYAVNTEDVYYHYNPETRQLKVSCRVPIQIVNLETGYRLQYVLQSFSHDYLQDHTRWSGQVSFSEMIPKNDRQKKLWNINREKVYQSSVINFLRSLYHDSLPQEGFLLNYINDSDSKNEKKTVSPQLSSKDLLLSTDSLSNSKVFAVSTDSALLLTCFGKSLTTKDLLKYTNSLSHKSYVGNIGKYRNNVKFPDGTIQIFTDGTYMNTLRLDVYQSQPINGINMMLPIEYGLTTESSALQSPKTIDHQAPLPFVMNIDNLTTQDYPEKIYLTTDRPYYAAGDTIWISAWVLNGGTLESTDKSRMLHVELIRPDGAILRNLVLDASHGVACGQFALPKNIIGDALFRIRAYTRWSLNFNESYRFEKNIPVAQFKENVWQGLKIAENKDYEWARLSNGSYAWRRKTITNDELRITEKSDDEIPALDLQFLPEGGRWVTGFPCRMAFKALAENGRGVNVEGEIIDDLGETVAEFRSLHQGMGSVFLTPQSGRKYHARLFSGHTVDLPAPDSTGVVMSLQSAREDTLLLQVYFPPETVRKNETFYLVAQSRGMYANTWEIQASRSRVSQFLPINDFQTGIARFTLYTQEGVPCNERLIFIDKEDEIKLVASPLSREEGQGVRIQIQAKDSYNLPVQGVFTVSVTDSLYGIHDIRDATLRSQMFLSSDLKGKIEHAGWYFQDRDSLRRQLLDLVMQTHGWSGYSWDDVKNAQDKIVFEPEVERTVSGKVTNLRNVGIKDASVTLWLEGVSLNRIKGVQLQDEDAKSIFRKASTDAQGRFTFKDLQTFGNTKVLAEVERQKGIFKTLALGIELDEQPETPSPLVEALHETEGREVWEELLAMYRQQKQNDEYLLDSLLNRTDSEKITEVVIEGKRPVKGSWNLNGPGRADHVLYEEDIASHDKFDRLLDVIKAEYPQLEQVSWRKIEILRNWQNRLERKRYIQTENENSEISDENPQDSDENPHYLYESPHYSDERLQSLFGNSLTFGGRQESSFISQSLAPQSSVESPQSTIEKPQTTVNSSQFSSNISNPTVSLSPSISSNLTHHSTDFPVWSYQGRPVVFILNGRILPMDIPSADNLQLPPNEFIDSLRLVARNFWNIPAKDINGIELLDSSDYLWAYNYIAEKYIVETNILGYKADNNYYSTPNRLLIIIVTTHSGNPNLEHTPFGTAEQYIKGFAVPKAFYVPKYYPEDIGGQAEYDVKPTLYWNPEVVTGRDGKAEIQFPVGLKPRGLQIRVEGIDLRGGIGSITQGMITGK